MKAIYFSERKNSKFSKEKDNNRYESPPPKNEETIKLKTKIKSSKFVNALIEKKEKEKIEEKKGSMNHLENEDSSSLVKSDNDNKPEEEHKNDNKMLNSSVKFNIDAKKLIFDSNKISCNSPISCDEDKNSINKIIINTEENIIEVNKIKEINKYENDIIKPINRQKKPILKNKTPNNKINKININKNSTPNSKVTNNNNNNIINNISNDIKIISHYNNLTDNKTIPNISIYSHNKVNKDSISINKTINENVSHNKTINDINRYSMNHNITELNNNINNFLHNNPNNNNNHNNAINISNNNIINNNTIVNSSPNKRNNKTITNNINSLNNNNIIINDNITLNKSIKKDNNINLNTIIINKNDIKHTKNEMSNYNNSDNFQEINNFPIRSKLNLGAIDAFLNQSMSKSKKINTKTGSLFSGNYTSRNDKITFIDNQNSDIDMKINNVFLLSNTIKNINDKSNNRNYSFNGKKIKHKIKEKKDETTQIENLYKIYFDKKHKNIYSSKEKTINNLKRIKPAFGRTFYAVFDQIHSHEMGISPYNNI